MNALSTQMEDMSQGLDLNNVLRALAAEAASAYEMLYDSMNPYDDELRKATGDLEGYMRGRQKDVPITIRKTGLLTGLVIHWTLRCDDTFHFHSGPENRDLVAWDQSVRLVPVEMRLAEGQTLVVRASHDHEACRVGLPQVHPSMVAGCVGHLELFDPRHAQEQLEQQHVCLNKKRFLSYLHCGRKKQTRFF